MGLLLELSSSLFLEGEIGKFQTKVYFPRLESSLGPKQGKIH
jgi:hypothetical protein